MIVDAVEIPVFDKLSWLSQGSSQEVSADVSPPESASDPNFQASTLQKRKRKDSTKEGKPQTSRERSTHQARAQTLQFLRSISPEQIELGNDGDAEFTPSESDLDADDESDEGQRLKGKKIVGGKGKAKQGQNTEYLHLPS